MEWRGLTLDEKFRDFIHSIEARTEELPRTVFIVIKRLKDDAPVREELLQFGVKPVTTADPGLIGARLGQLQGYRSRLGSLYHDVDYVYQYYKKVYEAAKAVIMPYLKSIASSEAERTTVANVLYLAKEWELMDSYKQLREAIQYRQTILSSEGETLSRQLSAITIQWSLVQSRGGRYDDLDWSSLEKAEAIEGKERGVEEW